MSATLTVTLDAEILERAEKEARARQTTVREVIAQYLRIMAENWQESHAGKTPITDELRGSLQLPADFDEKEFVTRELLKKHGFK